jgi:ABC-type sugar transport system permease subunit
MRVESNSSGQSSPSHTLRTGLLRLLGLFIFDAFASLFVYLLYFDGYWQFAVVMAFITIMINFIWLREDAYPLRWMSPGLAFMILISVYPIIFTIYISFTNFGTGHVLPKPQAIEVLEQRTYLPEAGASFDYAVFQAADDSYALWLLPVTGGEGFLALEGEVQTLGTLDAGPLDEEGIPESIAGYERLSRRDLVRALGDLSGITYGVGDQAAQVTSQLGRATALEQRYVYDADADTILDRQAEILYTADVEVGYFVSSDGQELSPGYQVTVGTRNFTRFINNPSFRGPLLRIFLWTFAFAFLSVLFSFSLGLLIAIAFGRKMPGQRFIKSMLIIPFAIPNVITVLIWKGLFNPLNGFYANSLADIFNQPVGWPPFFSDAIWVKVALIIINVWLAYPYFMLINSGALQAIPTDMYEAAEIDGANAWQQFRSLTLPMLLVGVGPLLIASFTTNFNSFNVIFLFNSGGPPIVGTSTPAGHSDILISYVYRLAFGSGGGQDFGYAAAITMIIFVILVGFTLFQYRYMKVWEEVSESV